MTLRTSPNSIPNQGPSVGHCFWKAISGRTQRENGNIHWEPGIILVTSMLGLRYAMLVPARRPWHFSDSCFWNISANNLWGIGCVLLSQDHWRLLDQERSLNHLEFLTLFSQLTRKTRSGCRVGGICPFHLIVCHCCKSREAYLTPGILGLSSISLETENQALILSADGSTCPSVLPSIH